MKGVNKSGIYKILCKTGWKGDWLITKKDGTIIRVKSLHTFAKENNYSQGNLHMVCTGRRNYSKDIIKVERVKEELL